MAKRGLTVVASGKTNQRQLNGPRNIHAGKNGDGRNDAGRRSSTESRLLGLTRLKLRMHRISDHSIFKYSLALACSLLVSLLAVAIERRVHDRGIVLFDVIAVFWVGTALGRGPAILAALSSFAVQERYFGLLPRLTDWLWLLLMILIAIELGQHSYRELSRLIRTTIDERSAIRFNTSKSFQTVIEGFREELEELDIANSKLERSVQRLTAIAVDSREKTNTLYELSQFIVSTSNTQELLAGLADRTYKAFQQAGVVACSLIVRDTDANRFVVKATAPESTPRARKQDYFSEHMSAVHYVVDSGEIVGGLTVQDDRNPSQVHHVCYIPLHGRNTIVGVLAIAGTPNTIGMTHRHSPAAKKGGWLDWLNNRRGPYADLFLAFRDQITLAIEHADAQARQVVSMKHVMVDMVAHQIRSPLLAVRGEIQNLKKLNAVIDAQARETRLTTALRQIDQMDRQVANLLALGMVESGGAVLRRKSCDPADIVNSALNEGMSTTEAEQRVIVDPVLADLPPVFVDFHLIREVVGNLIENAAKYSPAEAQILITGRVNEHADCVEVSIADEGIGIHESDLGLIFQQYYRSELTPMQVQKLGGAESLRRTGLGLAVCKAVIEAHGGYVHVNSTVGMGSTFTIALPMWHDDVYVDAKLSGGSE